jgi:hypothetical protein
MVHQAMESKGHIIKVGGSREEIDLRCPKCKTLDVIVYCDRQGYYDVLECNKCGYLNNNKT